MPCCYNPTFSNNMTSTSIKLQNISIVLHQPRYSENIGSTARVMLNMGIDKLIVVEPENFDPVTAEKLATHMAKHLLDEMEIHDSLKDALSSFQYVIGTTARTGGQRVVESPRRMAEKLVSISRDNQIALLFGREDKGLANKDLRLCHALVNIPTASFSSLNLSKAVMVICHEIFSVTKHIEKQYIPRLAGRNELDLLYEEMEEMLAEISYINPENPDYWMTHLRNFLGNINLQAKDVNIIRGVIRHILKYGEKRYKQGINDSCKSD